MPTSIGTKTTNVNHVLASFVVRHAADANSSRAAAKHASGARPRSTHQPRSTALTLSVPGARRAITIATPAMLIASAPRANAQVAIHLPNTISRLAIGVRSSGTNDRRSRSPAVMSIATAIPPVKTDTSAKTDSMLSRRAGLPPAWPENDTTITTSGPIKV